MRFRVAFKGSIGGKVELHGETGVRLSNPSNTLDVKLPKQVETMKDVSWIDSFQLSKLLFFF